MMKSTSLWLRATFTDDRRGSCDLSEGSGHSLKPQRVFFSFSAFNSINAAFRGKHVGTAPRSVDHRRHLFHMFLLFQKYIHPPSVASANNPHAFFTLRRFKCTNPLKGAGVDCKLTFTYTSRRVYETTIRLKLEPLGSTG